MVRTMTWLGRIAAVWLLGSLLGALAALGPARWADEVTVGSIGAGAGIVVLLATLVWLIRQGVRGRSRTILAAIAGTILVAVAAMPVGVAVWATHPPHADVEGPAPEGALEVAIDVDDTVTLAGWYFPTTSGAAVVLSHGAGSTRDDVLRQAEVLADAGYGVLAIDARGHGESSGEAMDLGWWGEADISAAIDALVAIDGVDPERIGLVGISMGGEESLGAAGQDPRVKVVVAEGATQRTAQDKSGWLPRHPLGWLQRGMDAERDVLVRWLTEAPQPRTLRSSAGASDVPVLLITAGTVPDEAAAAAWIAKGNSRVETWAVENARHTGGLATAPEQWRERVVGFLDAAIGT
ncbi:alpha/beta fold hydrolase [Demequina sp. TTPB684]|uniref:alpha/beta hydrolase n=1 Tax=unclassified Demequina TaxID=2620311 RepID=UPI001CF3A0E9|nr:MULTISPECIES: alpha/beta fold hydrolase [unclassified Demequina]MCB2412170.1 alpha/beta fold hydrolase [Demequina sp. TTPB684]UPU89638.1 alpha/beta fold hydrolase [Demequina sp. TMPB413]